MKQNLLHTIGLCLLALLLALVGRESYHAYMGAFSTANSAGHEYYYDMLSSKINRRIVIWMIISALIPIGTMIWSKKFSLQSTIISFAGGLLVSWYAHTYLKDGFVWWSSAFLFTFNMLFLIALVGIFTLWLYVVWAKIYSYITKTSITSRYDILFALGFGLAAFCIINYLLIFLNLFYPILAWAQLIAAIYLVFWKSQTERQQANDIITQSVKLLWNDSVRSYIITYHYI